MALIFIIEDNEQNLYLIKYLLEKNGFDVDYANNGFIALEKLKEIKPEIILLDIQLPYIDGYNLAKKIKNIESLKNIPIIAVTSYAMPGDKEKAFESGCIGYIEKPINPDTFIDEIKKFIKIN
ncbi:MAG: response regulator [Spirochaetes bacterium]|nr:response regulator [Spirochaetota bacterium]